MAVRNKYIAAGKFNKGRVKLWDYVDLEIAGSITVPDVEYHC